MADATSAGTLIAAVMETAGYVTQSHLLREFKELFQYGGMFVYTLGAIGGVVSVAMFGSFRAARYMLVGPVLYFTLVGPTTMTQGAVWKLGDGKVRVQSGLGASTEEASTQNLQALERARSVDEQFSVSPASLQGQIEVSMVFEWFTSIINGFVNGAVGIILKQEDSEDLLFIAKTRALETLISAQSDKPELYKMLENNLLGECSDMTNAAIALSNPELAQSVENQIRSEAGSLDYGPVRTLAQADSIKSNREYYQNIYGQASLRGVRPNQATAEFIARNRGAGESQRVVNQYLTSDPAFAGREVDQIKSQMWMTCDDLWKVTNQALVENAEWLVQKVQAKFSQSVENTPEGRQLLCEALSKKLYGQTGNVGQCNLVQATAVLLLRNGLASRNYSRVLQKKKNNMAALQTIPGGTKVYTDGKGDANEVASGMGSSEDKRGRSGIDGVTAEESIELEYANDERPFVKVTSSSGQMDAALVDHIAYQTRGLRQKIFSFALMLPYYQGMALYLIAIAYPFVALVVLIPGRAMSVFLIPLAWLWIKSWDIGFAAVRVFDKVMWAMLPHRDMPINAMDTSQHPLPSILHEAFKVDPMYNVHSYYMMIAMALLAVPPITGYATMKAKKSMLASFTDVPNQAASEANELAESVAGVRMMNTQTRHMEGMLGAAVRSVGGQGQGLLGSGGRAPGSVGGGAEIGAWAGASAVKDLFKGGNPLPGFGALGAIAGRNPEHPGAAIGQGILSAAKNGSSAASKFLDLVTKDRAAYEANLGGSDIARFGVLPMRSDAIQAAFDGGGGFEINAKYMNDVIDARINLIAGEFEIAADLMRGVASGTLGASKVGQTDGVLPRAVSNFMTVAFGAASFAHYKARGSATEGTLSAPGGPGPLISSPDSRRARYQKRRESAEKRGSSRQDSSVRFKHGYWSGREAQRLRMSQGTFFQNEDKRGRR